MDDLAGAMLVRAFSSVTDEMPNTDQCGLITGLAIDTAHNILAVDNLAKLVKVFDQMGTYKYCFGEGILKQPWDVFITSSGKIGVSDPGDGDIKVFSRSGKYLLRSEKGRHLNYPHGIDYHPWTKETVIADRGFSCIYIHDPKGEVCDMVTKQDSEYGLGSPNYACFDYAGNIYVTDLEDQSLIAYDTDRQHIFTYGHPRYDHKDIELNNPGSVVVDRYGNVILADTGNCRVHLVDKNGSLKGYLLTWEDGLGEPQAMTLTEDGSLIVSEANTGVIKIFSYTHLEIVNEVHVKAGGGGDDMYEIQSIESGPSLSSEEEDNGNTHIDTRQSGKSRSNSKISNHEQSARITPAHELHRNVDHLSAVPPSREGAKSGNNSARNAPLTSGNMRKENKPQTPPLKGILKNSKTKPKFDFFKSKYDRESDEEHNSTENQITDHPTSAKSHTSHRSAYSKARSAASSKSTHTKSAQSSRRNPDEQRKPSAISRASKSAKSYKEEVEVGKLSALSRGSNAYPGFMNENVDVDDKRVQSAKSVASHRSHNSEIPLVIIDTVPTAKTALPRLNLKLNSTKNDYRHKPTKTCSLAALDGSRQNLYKSSTSIASAESKASLKSQNTAVSIGNFSAISKENGSIVNGNFLKGNSGDLTIEVNSDEIANILN